MKTTIKLHLRYHQELNQSQLFGMDMTLMPLVNLFYMDSILTQIGMPIIQERLRNLAFELGRELFTRAKKANPHLQSLEERKHLITAIFKSNGFGILRLEGISEQGGTIYLDVDALPQIRAQLNTNFNQFLDFLLPYLQAMLCGMLHLGRDKMLLEPLEVIQQRLSFRVTLTT